MNVRCFFLSPSALTQRELCRYALGADCPSKHMGGRHDASVEIGVMLYRNDDEGGRTPPHSDPRWPLRCRCGYEFRAADSWQYNERRLYRRSDTGHLTTLLDAPVGAMWFAEWLEGYPGWTGADGHSLHVRLPGGYDWCTDSRASNCDMPTDTEHKCWVRHGTPPGDIVHVDKNGRTCHAGAGSIVVPGYHGFLHNGHLVDC